MSHAKTSPHIYSYSFKYFFWNFTQLLWWSPVNLDKIVNDSLILKGVFDLCLEVCLMSETFGLWPFCIYLLYQIKTDGYNFEKILSLFVGNCRNIQNQIFIKIIFQMKLNRDNKRLTISKSKSGVNIICNASVNDVVLTFSYQITVVNRKENIEYAHQRLLHRNKGVRE